MKLLSKKYYKHPPPTHTKKKKQRGKERKKEIKLPNVLKNPCVIQIMGIVFIFSFNSENKLHQSCSENN